MPFIQRRSRALRCIRALGAWPVAALLIVLGGPAPANETTTFSNDAPKLASVTVAAAAPRELVGPAAPRRRVVLVDLLDDGQLLVVALVVARVRLERRPVAHAVERVVAVDGVALLLEDGVVVRLARRLARDGVVAEARDLGPAAAAVAVEVAAAAAGVVRVAAEAAGLDAVPAAELLLGRPEGVVRRPVGRRVEHVHVVHGRHRRLVEAPEAEPQ